MLFCFPDLNSCLIGLGYIDRDIATVLASPIWMIGASQGGDIREENPASVAFRASAEEALALDAGKLAGSRGVCEPFGCGWALDQGPAHGNKVKDVHAVADNCPETGL